MPDFTTASAMLLIMSSLTLQPNLFQEFHPMGGVSARFAETGTSLLAQDAEAGRRKAARRRYGKGSSRFHARRFTRSVRRLVEGRRCVLAVGMLRLREGRLRLPSRRLHDSVALDAGSIYNAGRTEQAVFHADFYERFSFRVAKLRACAKLSRCADRLQSFLSAGDRVGPGERAVCSVGVFEEHGDVGTVLHPGSVDYDAAKRTYTISGSGENMWLAADAFQFVWKKVSGDVTLTADISFLTKTGNEHKKAALMLRQSLDADSVYADVALHASGLTSLQFRDEKGAVTREIQSNLSAPKRLRIAKRGDYVYMSLAADGGDLQVAGGWLRIPLQGDVLCWARRVFA